MAFVLHLVYVGVSAFFISKVWRDRSASWVNWLTWVFSAGGYVLILHYVGGWCLILGGVYLRYLILAAFLVAVARSSFAVNRNWCFSVSGAVSLLAVGCFAVFQVFGVIGILRSSSRIPKSIELDFPLKGGDYCILQGGNDPLINHHFEANAQRYAIDVVKLNSFGLRSKLLQPYEVENYYVFDEMLYSPCAGQVVESVDGCQDLKPGMMEAEGLAGNYLLIKIDDSDLLVLLAHLKRGSLLVGKGDLVMRGQPIGRVGNSGNTTEPHLHMHVVRGGSVLNEDEYLFDNDGVPMEFGGKFLMRNDRICSP